MGQIWQKLPLFNRILANLMNTLLYHSLSHLASTQLESNNCSHPLYTNTIVLPRMKGKVFEQIDKLHG